jgi:hypothetical protein
MSPTTAVVAFQARLPLPGCPTAPGGHADGRQHPPAGDDHVRTGQERLELELPVEPATRRLSFSL